MSDMYSYDSPSPPDAGAASGTSFQTGGLDEIGGS